MVDYEPMICPMCDDPCHLLSHLSFTGHSTDIGGRRDIDEVCVDFENEVIAFHADS